MTLLKKLVPPVLALCMIPVSLFGYNPEDTFVDIETANNDVNERQTEVDRLRGEVDSLVADTAEQESYIEERTVKLLQVEEALDKMNGTIADMLKIMSEMNDSKARVKFQDSITSSRETRDELIKAYRTLTRQINESSEKITQNRYQELIDLSKIERLNGEIEILRVQIARTEEQERRLEFTIQQANQSLQEVSDLMSGVGDL